MIRTVIFGSHFCGYSLLAECLNGELASLLDVVGVVSDDPTQSHCKPDQRIWQHIENEYERTMVVRLAEEHGIETYTGDIEESDFMDVYEKKWDPELGLMSVFGQFLHKGIRATTKYKIYNFHPSSCERAEDWPIFRFANALEQIIESRRWMNIVMHEVDDKFDHGPFVDMSSPIWFPKGTTVRDLLLLSATDVGNLARKNVGKIVGSE